MGVLLCEEQPWQVPAMGIGPQSYQAVGTYMYRPIWSLSQYMSDLCQNDEGIFNCDWNFIVFRGFCTDNDGGFLHQLNKENKVFSLLGEGLQLQAKFCRLYAIPDWVTWCECDCCWFINAEWCLSKRITRLRPKLLKSKKFTYSHLFYLDLENETVA